MDGMLLKRGGDPSKLKTIDEHYVATENQTVFPIEYVTFDYKRDRVDVISGRTALSPELDYTVESKKVVLVEGVPAGRTVTIRIMKNVNTDAEDKTMSGAYIEDASIPLSKLAEEVSLKEHIHTAQQVGALPLTGGTLSGAVNHEPIGIASYGNNKRGWTYFDQNSAVLAISTEPNNLGVWNSPNNRFIEVCNSGYKDIADALRLSNVDENKNRTAYTIFGDHNKPSGTYTGNGSATARVIVAPMSSVYSVFVLYGDSWLGFVYAQGAVFISGTTVKSFDKNAIRTIYDNTNPANTGIRITSTDSMFNGNGKTYRYHML